MTDPLLRTREIERRREPAGASGPHHPGVDADLLSEPFDVLEDIEAEFEMTPEPAAQADRRNARRKLAAGWRGLKAAIRGDSSFFAHFYRGTLIAITAALLGINQWSWCLLLLGACLVLIAELAHSAVDTLARAIDDPEKPRLKTAREIAAAGVLVAAFGSGAVTVLVLSWKFFELLGWRL
jgi:diacylglycerol kinase